MRKLIWILSLALIFAACSEITGFTKVFKPLNVIDKKGKAFQIQPGQVETVAKLKNDSRELSVKFLKVSQDKNIEIKIKIPEGVVIPQDSGSLELSGAQTGQPFNLKAELSSKTTTGPTQDYNRACTYYTYVQRCGERCHTVSGACRKICDSNNHCRTVCEKDHTVCRHTCWDESIPHSGSQYVRGYNVCDSKGLKLEFLDAQSAEITADFDAQDSKCSFVTTYSSPCSRY